MAEAPQLEGEHLFLQGEPSKPGTSEWGEYSPSIFGIIYEISNAREKTSWLLPTCLADKGSRTSVLLESNLFNGYKRMTVFVEI